MIDKIFKIGLLVIGILFLFLYYQNSLNERYHFTKNADELFGQVFDSKTGRSYIFLHTTKNEPMSWAVLDPIKGTIKMTEALILKNEIPKQSKVVPKEDLPDNPPKDILADKLPKDILADKLPK